MFCKRVLFACALAALCGPANAANIEVSVNVSRVLLGDFVTEAEWTPEDNGALIESGQGTAYAQVDFFMEIHDLAGPPEEVGFGNVVFDVLMGGGASDAFGWIRDVRSIQHLGIPGPPPVYIWPDNADLGTPGDLIDIVAGVAPGSFGPNGIDLRRTLGQNGPEFMGSVFAGIDASAPGDVGTIEAVVKAFSTYNTDLQLARNDGEMRGDLTTIRVVPEPGGLTLMVFGSGAVYLLRRRRFPRSAAPLACNPPRSQLWRGWQARKWSEV